MLIGPIPLGGAAAIPADEGGGVAVRQHSAKRDHRYLVKFVGRQLYQLHNALDNALVCHQDLQFGRSADGGSRAYGGNNLGQIIKFVS